MTALQTVNLGTAPAGTDGDPVRTAFTKANSNVAVLNGQAALTSAAATITTAQALTAALHVGRRVNISLASPGTINLPAASTCSADQVTLLRNIGTTIVTLAITTGSGDTVTLSKLNPGETALIDTDGVHAWNVLMRGRTNSDNETVNGNCAVNGNETVGGTLAVTGATTLTGALSSLANTFFGSAGQASISSAGAYSGPSAGYSGNVGVGGTLGVTGLTTLAGGLVTNSLLGGGATVVGSSANTLALYSNNAQRALLDVSGSLHVNESAAWSAAQLSVRNSATNTWGISAYAATQNGGCFLGRTDSSAVPLAAWFFGASNVGTITTNGTSTTYGTTSDYRLKAFWREIEDPVHTLMRIRFYEGEFKAQPGVKAHYVIAHELQDVLHYAVAGEKDAVDKRGRIVPQVVDYSKIVPLMGASIQRHELDLREAIGLIKRLESRISELESK
jgi:hypothetical protein